MADKNNDLFFTGFFGNCWGLNSRVTSPRTNPFKNMMTDNSKNDSGCQKLQCIIYFLRSLLNTFCFTLQQ